MLKGLCAVMCGLRNQHSYPHLTANCDSFFLNISGMRRYANFMAFFSHRDERFSDLI